MRDNFLEELAVLCEKYNAIFTYTNDDDGTHIFLDGKEEFVGYLCCTPFDAALKLRKAKSTSDKEFS